MSEQAYKLLISLDVSPASAERPAPLGGNTVPSCSVSAIADCSYTSHALGSTHPVNTDRGERWETKKKRRKNYH